MYGSLCIYRHLVCVRRSGLFSSHFCDYCWLDWELFCLYFSPLLICFKHFCNPVLFCIDWTLDLQNAAWTLFKIHLCTSCKYRNYHIAYLIFSILSDLFCVCVTNMLTCVFNLLTCLCLCVCVQPLHVPLIAPRGQIKSFELNWIGLDWPFMILGRPPVPPSSSHVWSQQLL